jgi:hypothetical protein
LHALGRIYHEQRSLTRAQAAGDLVAEVDVAGRVDQLKLITLPIFGSVLQTHRLRFDRNAALALELQFVQKLIDPLPRADRSRDVQDPIGERALAVVHMSNDGKISDFGRLGRHGALTAVS